MLKFNIVPHTYSSKKTIIFLGNGNRNFGEKVASYFPGCLSDCVLEKFSDGEIKIPKIKENIRKKNCILIQSISVSTKGTINDLLMELLILIDACKRGSAKSITVILPIYPYQRQDRKSYSRAPISAKVIANTLESQGVDRVICFDLHAEQIQGFFDKVPLDNLYTEPYFIHYIKNHMDICTDNLVIVSPDEGGVKRATRVAEKIGCAVAIMYKERNGANSIGTMVLMGEVKNKHCFIIDDMIDTAGTACKASKILKDNGAENIFMGVCHGVLSGPAVDRITQSDFTKVIVTNTVEVEERFGEQEKIDIIDVSEMCAASIDRSLTGSSLSELMDL